LDELAIEGNQVVVTQGGHIRETTVSLDEILGGWEFDSRLEVRVNDRLLVRRHLDIVRETSSGSDQGSWVGANFLSGGCSACEFAADRGLSISAGSGVGGVGEHGSSNGKNPRAGSRENGRQGLLSRVIAIRISITRSTLISGSSKEGDSSQTDLLEFNVSTVHILLGSLISSAVANLALAGLRPSPAHADNKRCLVGSKQIDGKVVHPASNSPEPHGGGLCNCSSVFDIKGRFCIRGRGLEGTHNVANANSRGDVVLFGKI